MPPDAAGRSRILPVRCHAGRKNVA
jgi:hypothetical protein